MPFVQGTLLKFALRLTCACSCTTLVAPVRLHCARPQEGGEEARNAQVGSKDNEGKRTRSDSPSKLAALSISVPRSSPAARSYSRSSRSDSTTEQHRAMPTGSVLPQRKCISDVTLMRKAWKATTELNERLPQASFPPNSKWSCCSRQKRRRAQHRQQLRPACEVARAMRRRASPLPLFSRCPWRKRRARRRACRAERQARSTPTSPTRAHGLGDMW